MPDRRRTTCRCCGGHRDDVGSISWSGLCQRCALDRVAENILGLHYHEGPAHERWRRGMIACALEAAGVFDAAPVDDAAAAA